MCGTVGNSVYVEVGRPLNGSISVRKTEVANTLVWIVAVGTPRRGSVRVASPGVSTGMPCGNAVDMAIVRPLDGSVRVVRDGVIITAGSPISIDVGMSLVTTEVTTVPLTVTVVSVSIRNVIDTY